MKDKLRELFKAGPSPEYKEHYHLAALIPYLIKLKPYDVIIYGADSLGYLNLLWLRRNGLEPLFMVDRDPAKSDDSFFGVEIIAPAALAGRIAEARREVLALVAVFSWEDPVQQDEISRLLYRSGCGRVYYNKSIMYHQHSHWSYFFASNQEALLLFFDRLADEESQETFYEFVRAVMWDDDYRREGAPTDQKYFDPELVGWSDEEHLVHCGACLGENIWGLIDRRQPFKKAHCFEPNDNYFRAADEFLQILPPEIQTKIKLLNMAVGHEEDQRLDSILKGQKVTHISMDIEGAELSALQGAGNIIREQEPVLAISAYHRRDDLMALPRYIDSLSNNYQYYLRKYVSQPQATIGEMVLYALPAHRAGQRPA